MEKFIKENCFKVIVILLIALIFSIYYKNNSVSEIYKIDSDCSKQAIAFAQSQSNDFTSWDVQQSSFNIKKVSCFAEFSSWSSITKGYNYYVYDLTHNKQLVGNKSFEVGEDVNLYDVRSRDYDKVKNDVFNK